LRLEAREPLFRRLDLAATTRIDRDSILLLLSKRRFDISKSAYDVYRRDERRNGSPACGRTIDALPHAVRYTAVIAVVLSCSYRPSSA
jgi:hypothetical protein